MQGEELNDCPSSKDSFSTESFKQPMHMNNRLYRKTSPFLRKETFNVYFSIVNVYFFAVNVYFWCLGYYADMEISVMKLISLAQKQIVKENLEILCCLMDALL